MGIVTGILVYVMFWWLIFFMTLPWGVKLAPDNNQGHMHGAPVQPHLGRKIIATTVITTILFILYTVYVPYDLLQWPVFQEP